MLGGKKTIPSVNVGCAAYLSLRNACWITTPCANVFATAIMRTSAIFILLCSLMTHWSGDNGFLHTDTLFMSLNEHGKGLYSHLRGLQG